MNPYYEDDSCTIYHGDCREVLPDVRGGALVVSDPPYNIGYHYDSYGDHLPPEEYDALLVSLGEPAVLSHYPEALMRLAWSPAECVAWVYHAHVGPSWRMVAWYGVEPDFALHREPYRNPDDKRVARLMERSPGRPSRDWWLVEQVKNVSAEKGDHPCPVPEGLVSRILTVTPEPSVVVDPFMGSGTTLRVAKNLGRPAIGIEVDERYCEIAAKRLGQEVLDLGFNDPREKLKA